MGNSAKRRIEVDAPVEALYQLAIREGNSKKPVYEMHKWWARRLGSVFRMLLLLATAPETQSDEELWKRFYEGDNLSHIRLLDPFLGGGTSVVEALKLGIKSAGIDIDPVAWFISRQEINKCDLSDLKKTFEELEKCDTVAQIKSLYRTSILTNNAAGSCAIDKQEADVIYNFWVDVIACPNCGYEFEAHNHYKLVDNQKKPTKTVFCKDCHQPHNIPTNEKMLVCNSCGERTDIEKGPISKGYYLCPSCNHKGKIVDLATPGLPFRKNWFGIQYLDPSTNIKAFKVPDETDKLGYIRAQELLKGRTDNLPWKKIPLEGRTDPRPTNFGFDYYHQLFNPRQQLSLNYLYEWIRGIEDGDVRNYFILAFSDALASNNMFCSYAFGYDKLTPLFGLHAYRIVTRPVENNVWGTKLGRGSFANCFRKVINGKRYCSSPYESRYKKTNGKLEKIFIDSPIEAVAVSDPEKWYGQNDDGKLCLLLNQSSEQVSEIRDKAIDLILSDPPYYNNLSYSELSDFYYAWIKSDLERAGANWFGHVTPLKEALFVEQGNGKTEKVRKFIDSLSQVFCECSRILKDDGLFVFTFHHLDAVAWMSLAISLKSAHLLITKVFPVRSEGKSGFHSTEGTVKWDSVIVCRKSLEQEQQADPNFDLERYSQILLKKATQESEVWRSRLCKANIPFEWPDYVSLIFAFAVKEIILLRRDVDYRKLFHFLSDGIGNQLPDSSRILFRKRKAKII